MKLAYIIRAHHAPEHLVRLVSKLDTEGTSFFVHVNKRTDDETYSRMVGPLRERANVHWLRRHPCHWGGFSLVEATLEGIDEVCRRGVNADYTILLSGQDYPIRSNREIVSYLGARRGSSFLDHSALPSDRWSDENGGLDRIRYWHFQRVSFRTRLLRVRIPRRFPRGLLPYGGSAFWCLSHEAIQYVHRFVRENPSVVRFFRHVLHPDESFVQTVIMNSPLKDSVINDDLHYIDWSERRPNPRTLGRGDVDKILSSGKLFARKFPTTIEIDVLDIIDETTR